MAAMADGLDFISSLVSGVGSRKSGSGVLGAVLICYAGFGFWALFVGAHHSYLSFSSLLTYASFVQALGFALLSVKVRGDKSVAGLSSKSMQLFLLHLVTRLTSTSLKNGYIPMDKSGDFVYQMMDLCSLLLVCHLLYCIQKTYMHTYQAEHDTLEIAPAVVLSFVLAFCIHGHINRNAFFDICWAGSMNLEAFVLLPQLWMMSRMGGKMSAVTSHFIASVVVSGVMTFVFWYWTSPQLEKRGPNKIAQVIVIVQALKLLLSADFMYYYCHSWLYGTSMVLPARDGVEM